MSEEQGTTQAQEVEKKKESVDLSKFVPVAEFLSYKKKVEAFETAEEKRKEREMSAEQRAVKLEKEKAELEESLLKKNAVLDDIVTSTRNKLIAQLPEDRQERVKDWPVEQLETYVSDFTELNAGKGIPGGKPGTSEVGEYGGYESFSEWANKDPEGYREYRNSESRQKIVWATAT